MTERKTRIVRDTKRVRLDAEREMRGKSVVKEAGGVGGMDGQEDMKDRIKDGGTDNTIQG